MTKTIPTMRKTIQCIGDRSVSKLKCDHSAKSKLLKMAGKTWGLLVNKLFS